MSWLGHLHLQYRSAQGAAGPRTVAHDRHDGPLRVLQALYPESPGICHHVLVHPPGGIVGGDELHIDVDVQAGAHALITTPGATRFYRSAGPMASQSARLQVGPDARLEWLPLETLVHDGCRARNTLQLSLAEGASMIGWDSLALGLPASGQPLRSGCFEQQIDWPAHWLEQTRLDFEDPVQAGLTHRLLASPLGWRGHSVLVTAWCAARPAWSSQATEALTEDARSALSAHLSTHLSTPLPANLPAHLLAHPPTHPLKHSPASSPAIGTPPLAGQGLAASATGTGAHHPAAGCTSPPQPSWGVTSPHPGLVVARLLVHRTEAAWPALQAIRAAWRHRLWALPDVRPRVWRT